MDPTHHDYIYPTRKMAARDNDTDMFQNTKNEMMTF